MNLVKKISNFLIKIGFCKKKGSITAEEARSLGIIGHNQLATGHFLTTNSIVCGPDNPEPFTITKTLYQSSIFLNGQVVKTLMARDFNEAEQNHIEIVEYAKINKTLPPWLKDPFKS
jgi:hypothetical protein